jgi:protease I
MAATLDGKRVIIIAMDGVEQVELDEPRKALEEAGARVDLVAPAGESIQGMDHVDKSDVLPVDRTIDEVSVDEYDALVIPGGVVNSDHLRAQEGAVRFVRDFYRSGKPIGAICHGAWILIETGLLSGAVLTSYPTLQTDIRNAGATWVDQEAVLYKGLVSSRRPRDLPAFNDNLIRLIAEGRRHDRVPREQQGYKAAA